jgi:hypothetical protein
MTMVNLNLAIRQEGKDEASSFKFQISNSQDGHGHWHCIIENNDLPTDRFVIYKDSFDELACEVESYIKGLGIVIHVHKIDVPKEIKDWILRLKEL